MRERRSGKKVLITRFRECSLIREVHSLFLVLEGAFESWLTPVLAKFQTWSVAGSSLKLVLRPTCVVVVCGAHTANGIESHPSLADSPTVPPFSSGERPHSQ